MIVLQKYVILFCSCAGADYGLGTIGTCLGPPSPRRPPSDKKNLKITGKKKWKKNYKNGDIVGYVILFVNYN